LRQLRFITVLLVLSFSLSGQKVVRVTKNYVALKNEHVGAKGEQLIIRRPVNGKLINIGLVQVLLSKQGKTAAKIIREFGSYHIHPGDFAFKISLPNQAKSRSLKRPWRFRLGMGPGKRIGDLAQNIPPNLQSYHDQLKSGTALFSDISYFIRPSHGFGWMFSQWWTSHAAENRIFYKQDMVTYDFSGDIENDIQIIYTGPILVIRHDLPNSRLHMNSLFTAGSLIFRDRQKIIRTAENPVQTENEEIDGYTFGIGGNIGLEYPFTDAFGLFADFMFLFGTLPRQNTESNLYQDRISLNRLDIHIGLMFNF